jgi:hypothetical protein
MTTNNSISVKPARAVRMRTDMDVELSAGSGKRVQLRPTGTWPAADGLRMARPDARGRSIRTEARRAGLLAFGSCRPRTAFPPCGSGLKGPRAWPITAAAPRRIYTVFPILPRHASGRGHLSRSVGIRIHGGWRRQDPSAGPEKCAPHHFSRQTRHSSRVTARRLENLLPGFSDCDVSSNRIPGPAAPPRKTQTNSLTSTGRAVL